MGRPKALLPCRGGTFLGSILQTLEDARIPDVRVVLGHESARIRAGFAWKPGQVVENGDYDSGMLSSVRAGIRALPVGVSAFLLWPVDHPLVTAATVRILVDEHDRSGRPIVVPSYRGKRGHPTLFAASLAPVLLAAPDAGGARSVVRERHADVVEAAVDDPGVVTDIDTPEAYEAALGPFGS
jgi:CTP:molybdopterin cytidylyltransferase MocA